MSVRPNELGPWSETDTLECALSWLQDTDDPTLRRSALGSRLSLHLAERTPEADQRENLAAEGVRFAEAAIALGADGDGAVHYYLAANLGLVIRDHVTLAMENLPRLQSEMQRAVDLSPEIDDGGPLRLLGILYLKAPPWPTGFGDGEKALDLLREAVEKHPDHPLNRLFYAEVLWEADESSHGGSLLLIRIQNQIQRGAHQATSITIISPPPPRISTLLFVVWWPMWQWMSHFPGCRAVQMTS